jgi:hypothetical protein
MQEILRRMRIKNPQLWICRATLGHHFDEIKVAFPPSSVALVRGLQRNTCSAAPLV